MILDFMGWSVALLGAALVFIGAVGVVRMPELFTRMHAAGVIDSLGAALVLIGVGVVEGFTTTTTRLLMVLAFVWITSPTTSHALAKSAWAAGQRPWIPLAPEQVSAATTTDHEADA